MESTPDRAAGYVLVVDDNRDTADSMTLLLGLWGYRPLVAYDGPSALVKAAEAGSCVAALIDLALPGIDGYELLQRLRGLRQMSAAVFLAVSGYGREEDRRRCREVGFHHHLLKPADVEEVRRLLPAPE
jgi:CheY-like chemotaxis protein